jgi:hypothetical protein
VLLKPFIQAVTRKARQDALNDVVLKLRPLQREGVTRKARQGALNDNICSKF